MSKSTEIREKHAGFFSHLFFVDFTHIQLFFLFVCKPSDTILNNAAKCVLGRCCNKLQQSMLPAHKEGPWGVAKF